MYIADCNKDLIFFSAFLDLQRWGHNPKELIFFNALTDALITSRKSQVEVANSGKTMTLYESIQAFQKISENSRFQSFELPIIERIPVVPGTSNNRGLTVYYVFISVFCMI